MLLFKEYKKMSIVFLDVWQQPIEIKTFLETSGGEGMQLKQ